MPGDILSLSKTCFRPASSRELRGLPQEHCLLAAGGVIGAFGLAWATFTGVSYFEVRK